MSEITLSELMARMPNAFIAEKAEGMEAVIQYELSGDEGGQWVVKIENGACTVEEGTIDNPKMTLTADAQDYKDVVLGKQNAMQSFMQGKLKLKGDLNLAMKLTSFFKLS